MKVTKTVFDLNTMDEVELVKTGEFKPVTTMEEFLAEVGNDTAKVLKVINDGRESMVKSALKIDTSVPWLTEDGKPFEGVQANQKAVNGLVLNLAKSVFGFKNARDAKPEEKDKVREINRASKEKALNFIKNSEDLKAGLIANASEDEETES